MVKNILKYAGITLSQFAGDLNISRPTLDNYIESYDKHEKIANTFYQDIFDFLFEDANISDADFNKRYRYMKDYYGMSSGSQQVIVSKLKSGYSVVKSEYSEVLEELQKYINHDNTNPTTSLETYKMILQILKSNNVELMQILKFYSIYKGTIKLDNLTEEEERLYSFLYEAMQKKGDASILVNLETLKTFKEYANNMFLLKNNNVEKIKETITNKLSQVITDELSSNDLENLDINEILELIKQKL